MDRTEIGDNADMSERGGIRLHSAPVDFRHGDKAKAPASGDELMGPKAVTN